MRQWEGDSCAGVVRACGRQSPSDPTQTKPEMCPRLLARPPCVDDTTNVIMEVMGLSSKYEVDWANHHVVTVDASPDHTLGGLLTFWAYPTTNVQGLLGGPLEGLLRGPIRVPLGRAISGSIGGPLADLLGGLFGGLLGGLPGGLLGGLLGGPIGGPIGDAWRVGLGHHMRAPSWMQV